MDLTYTDEQKAFRAELRAFLAEHLPQRLSDKVAGGKVTLGAVPGAKYEAVTALPGDVLGIALGLVFVAVAFALPGAPAAPTGAHMPAE